ncbi:hypothetical protein [Chryseobacterium sp. JK1]|uniref:hypothetical protein n=1 Tax=Chryseobacterium sp. JK1 TaxID=874294 RepID=UPI003D69800A
MLVCLSAFSKAQQGRVGINTTTPAATLDVVATTTDNTRPDALLVPRMTRAQLTAKDAAYIAAQNGALAFVTTIDGTASAKTTNVTTVGFYYYDSPSSTWKTLGGSAPNPALNVTSQVSNYTAQATDDIILFTTTGPTQLTLPTTGVTIGKRIYVSVIGTTDITLNPVPRETANQTLITGQGNILMYTGDAASPWSIISGY